MPSGTFRSIELSSISIDRAKRQRRELRGIEELAESMRKLGQIHPILIQRESHELIAGERRYAAASLLGWTSIMAQYEDEIDPLELKVLELEENTRRSDLTWQEQCLAVDEYHTIMVARDPTWTQSQTAAALLMTDAGVTQKLSVSKEIKAGNKVVADAPKFSTARGIVDRAKSRAASADISRIMETEGAPTVEEKEPIILTQDFRLWAPSYSGPKFNFIHCDFPYGINAGDRHQGYNQEELGKYSDTPEEYWELLTALAKALPTIAQESCHLMFWFSMRYYHETLDFLSRNTPFVVDPFPLIWVKSDGAGLLPDAERGPRRVYETALFGASGDRKIVRATSNAISYPSTRDGHMSEKSQGMLEHFFRMFVDGSTSILDPTAGSGSALRAAKAVGASYLKGLEMNEEFAKRANERIK